MLVQLASTITSSQHATHEQKLNAVADGIEQSHCQSSAGSSNERRNTPSIRLSPKSSASQLLSPHSSAWACSERRLASYKPTQPGHPFVGRCNINCNIGNCKPSSYCCSSSSCHGTLLQQHLSSSSSS